MTLRMSRRAGQISQAEIRAMTIECELVGGVNLAQGVCDTEPPLPIRRAAQRAIERGINSYTRFDGLAELRKSIAAKLLTFNGIVAEPETQITVSAGSTGAFYCACLALLDPGDEVVLFEPYYGYHLSTIEAVGGVASYVRTSPPDWRFDPHELERVITTRTKGIMINTPSNPSGKVFDRAELEIIAGVARRHDLFVFTDEIYEYFTYDGAQHCSPATIPGLDDRTITISGVSKTYSITGWRIGYSVAPAQWAEVIGHMNDLVYVCAPAPLQAGVACAISELPASYYAELALEYSDKRERICHALMAAGLPPHIPQGAYYVLADISRLPGKTSKERVMHLLDRTKVACVPGEAFFHGCAGNNLARFCFAKKDSELKDACRRLERIA